MADNITGFVSLKKGYWYVVINLKGEDQIRKPKWIKTGLPEKNNKRRAQEILKEKLAEYEAMKSLSADNPLFHELLLEWLEDYINSGEIRTNTYENYKLILNAHAVPFFRELNLRVKEVTAVHISDYYRFLRKSGYSENTILKHHANIRKALAYAVERKMISANPADGMKLPKKKKYIASYYTAEQVIRLFEAVKKKKRGAGPSVECCGFREQYDSYSPFRNPGRKLCKNQGECKIGIQFPDITHESGCNSVFAELKGAARGNGNAFGRRLRPKRTGM